MEARNDQDELEGLTEFLYIVPVGLMKFRRDGLVAMANPLVAQLLMPFAPSGGLCDAYAALAPLMPDLARRVWEYPAPLGVIVDHEHCTLSVRGRQQTFSITVHRIHGDMNLAVIDDVTTHAEQERKLFEDRQRFRAIFENVRDYAIFTVDCDGRIDEWNHSLERFGGWGADAIVGQPLTIFFPLADENGARLRQVLDEARQAGSLETEGWWQRCDGSRVWTNTVLTALPDEDGEIRGFVIVSRDMTQRKQVEDELRRLATTDPLTGAFNRRHGQTCLQKSFVPRGVSGRGPAVLMMDIDHFKSINDQHGHDTGDLALCAVTDASRALVGEAGPVVRWGGEEFVLILPDIDAEGAVDLAERLRVTIAQVLVEGPTGPLGLTVSVGVALDHGRGFEDVIRRADVALYEAKRTGRNRVVLGPARRSTDVYAAASDR